MSLLSTFTSASINGWRGTGSTGYFKNYIIPPPSPVTSNGNFGYNCVISGNGNYCAITNFISSGTTSNVYVFIKNSDSTWSLQYTITGISNPVQLQLAINYEGTVLTFPGYGGTWPLYIYTRSGTTWSLAQTISLGSTSAVYVSSLIMDGTGDYIFCGQSNFNSNRGRIVIYSKSGSSWTLVGSIAPSGLASGAVFGDSIDVSNDGAYIVAGAPGANSSNGAVYVYNGTAPSWSLQQTITSFTGFANGGTAREVCIDDTGTYLFFNMGSTTAGIASRVYAYARSGSAWSQQMILYGNTTDPYHSFGDSIAVDNGANTLLIKAYSENYGGVDRAGKIYIYNKIGSAWANTQDCSSTPLQTDSMLEDVNQGLDISTDGSIFIFSTPKLNLYGPSAGAVFVFTN